MFFGENQEEIHHGDVPFIVKVGVVGLLSIVVHRKAPRPRNSRPDRNTPDDRSAPFSVYPWWISDND